MNIAGGTDSLAKEHITQAVYNQSNLSSGKITLSSAMQGLDIYNDSTVNTLTFTLKNGSNTIFSFTLNPSGNSKDSLSDEIFPPFTEIDITGTTPLFTTIVRS